MNIPTLAKRPRYANNLEHPNLGQKATLREQPSTSQPWPKGHATRTTFNRITFNQITFNFQPQKNSRRNTFHG
ncbi:MAG: hypothetical protein F6K26_29100 [Moorea sp. SIO2I5]|nr:hypothetical protein [Moorena sp. SIO2I5]